MEDEQVLHLTLSQRLHGVLTVACRTEKGRAGDSQGRCLVLDAAAEELLRLNRGGCCVRSPSLQRGRCGTACCSHSLPVLARDEYAAQAAGASCWLAVRAALDESSGFAEVNNMSQSLCGSIL
ncbi:hypothetical protein DUNSADRAFT_15069 [Dunaliella salina]|uniref:Uncharacterized protein n=1 Tax=Dunaliella salina TaxID=3046 RepID=A0ABQ7G639_DUNSA|nr:hypothetical protein DUNSADRAFT_15069 [Dunaliella salina]|eukprot:KAF5830069.1 hypothetical protein DUNSADRAFT_15069 [Dunaliella salina]